MKINRKVDSKKLGLAKETLRNLETTALQNVVGGAGTPTRDQGVCIDPNG